MSNLSIGVKSDISEFVYSCLADWKKDALEYDGLDLTVACSNDGTQWNYQTGDNSYTGGAYGLPHWAVVYIGEDTKADDLITEIIDQLEELLCEVIA